LAVLGAFFEYLLTGSVLPAQRQKDSGLT